MNVNREDSAYGSLELLRDVRDAAAVSRIRKAAETEGDNETVAVIASYTRVIGKLKRPWNMTAKMQLNT